MAIRSFSKVAWLPAALALLTAGNAQAVPAFARQTRLDCTNCHLSWLELSPTGRQFKLNGYTLGDRQTLPFAGMLQISDTSTSRVDPNSPDNFPKNNSGVLQQASLFAAGKISEHFGGFSQWTYDGVAHHSSIDNVDLRYANHLGEDGPLYGFTVNNNPGVQDVFNTVPAWGFPFASSSVSVAPNASTMIEEGLGQQVAGIGAYGLWHDTVYAELSGYRTADGLLSLFRAGVPKADQSAIKGTNPYWRLALQHEWEDGRQSAMVGAYGMTVDKYPDSTQPTGPTDRFRDLAFDAQYQYITDKHRWSAQLNWITEKQDWNASCTPDVTCNPSDTLRTFRAKGTYYYAKKYGINLGWFSTQGDADGIYNTGDPVTGSTTGSPNTTGYVVELDYLPKRDIRLMLQYTGYTKFNGARDNYDGQGRNARDNNSLYLLAWFMF